MRDTRRADGGHGQEKEWTGCFLDDLRAFGINANQWRTAAQDEGEWRKTAEQGAERKSPGWTTACSSMPERDGKDQGDNCPNQACSYNINS